MTSTHAHVPDPVAISAELEAGEHVDVVVIGGGAAGLGAALQLGRMRRSVVVVDAGEPRNAPAAHMHGYLGHDGLPPAELVAIARSEVAAYGVAVAAGSVAAVRGSASAGFTVDLDDDRKLTARRVVLATGLTDELPDIHRVREHWGRGVIHCPYCHGWEVRDQRIVVIDAIGVGAHQALLFRGLSDRVTLVVHAGAGPDEQRRAGLAAIGVEIVDATVAAIESDGDAISGVRLADGTVLPADSVVIGPRMRPNVAPVAALGIAPEPHPSGFAEVLATSPTGETSVRGIYAAGNVADPSHQVLQAAARGAQVGAFVNMDLAEEDAAAAVRTQRDAIDWDGRYGAADRQMWSGNPNGSLVVELERVAPGRILDVGCGEGADAIWLAAQGWDVTAVDISSVAIERARAAADAAGVTVEWQCADVLAAPPAAGAYDVVSIQYPALLREAGELAILRLVDAVRPGGTFLVVGHDIDREQAREHGHDMSRFVDLDGLRRALAGRFEIEVDEIRPRPNPPAGAHHVDDAILRARRPG
jgi:thioredoxin reductase/2-polyprenyl-3-methyl-5-hydroxy-6-metoxy-1,4-benzoquinol methylase